MESRIVPLNANFMLSSIIGFIISWAYVYPKTMPWGVTLMFFFALMFISSLVSMTYSSVDSNDFLKIGRKK